LLTLSKRVTLSNVGASSGNLPYYVASIGKKACLWNVYETAENVLRSRAYIDFCDDYLNEQKKIADDTDARFKRVEGDVALKADSKETDEKFDKAKKTTEDAATAAAKAAKEELEKRLGEVKSEAITAAATAVETNITNKTIEVNNLAAMTATAAVTKELDIKLPVVRTNAENAAKETVKNELDGKASEFKTAAVAAVTLAMATTVAEAVNRELETQLGVVKAIAEAAAVQTNVDDSFEAVMSELNQLRNRIDALELKGAPPTPTPEPKPVVNDDTKVITTSLTPNPAKWRTYTMREFVREVADSLALTVDEFVDYNKATNQNMNAQAKVFFNNINPSPGDSFWERVEVYVPEKTKGVTPHRLHRSNYRTPAGGNTGRSIARYFGHEKVPVGMLARHLHLDDWTQVHDKESYESHELMIPAIPV
jgi:hypothetical protein